MVKCYYENKFTKLLKDPETPQKDTSYAMTSFWLFLKVSANLFLI